MADAFGEEGVPVDLEFLQGGVLDCWVEFLLEAVLDEDVVEPVLHVFDFQCPLIIPLLNRQIIIHQWLRTLRMRISLTHLLPRPLPKFPRGGIRRLRTLPLIIHTRPKVRLVARHHVCVGLGGTCLRRVVHFELVGAADDVPGNGELLSGLYALQALVLEEGDVGVVCGDFVGELG